MNLNTSTDNTSSILNGETTFLMENAYYTLHINDESLYLQCIKKPESNPLPHSDLNKSVNLLNLVSVTSEADNWIVNKEGEPLLEYSFFGYYFTSYTAQCFSLTLNYWEKVENHRRKLLSFKLQMQHQSDCSAWKAVITRNMNRCLAKDGRIRPRNLLIILNPHAGYQKADHVHKTIASPLFKKAGIKETVFVSQYGGHVKEYLESNDLSSYDGIVALGGDGTFNEVVNGVLINEQQKKAIPLESTGSITKRPTKYAKPSVRIGFIPIGSANILAFTSQGVIDCETAALHIVCGESHPLDITSTHNDKGKFLRFSVLIQLRGFYSQMAALSEKMRWLGWMRYVVATFISLASLSYFSGEIRYLSDSSSDSEDLEKFTTGCTYPCATCLNKVNDENNGNEIFQQHDESETRVPANRAFKNTNVVDDDSIQNKQHAKEFVASKDVNDDLLASNSNTLLQAEPTIIVENESEANVEYKNEDNEKWKVIRGSFVNLTLGNTALRHQRSPGGTTPWAHFADGTNTLIIIYKASRKDFFNHISEKEPSTQFFRFPFVKVITVKAVQFRTYSEEVLSREYDEFNKSADDQEDQWQTSANGSKAREPDSSCWNIDGEETCEFDIASWVHKGLINIFARGIEDVKET